MSEVVPSPPAAPRPPEVNLFDFFFLPPPQLLSSPATACLASSTAAPSLCCHRPVGLFRKADDGKPRFAIIGIYPIPIYLGAFK
jgi:hypothetical protein